MSPLTLSSTDYRRLATVLRTLARTGARPALVRLGLLRGAAPDEVGDGAAYEGFVEALEELGPTFVKLGQIMATRSDMLPPELTERLGRLHDDVSPVPFEWIREQLTVDLGGSPDELFAEFSATPIAAASIAQVYAARLRTGEDVVVKVRRPGIEAVMRADLRLLAAAARVVERRVPALRRHQPMRVVTELSEVLLEEIDFRIEARNQMEIRKRATVFHVPLVHEQFTTQWTMVSTRVRGRSPNAAFRSEEPALARTLAPEAARGLLGMILLDGVFHADPHPGNVLVTPDGRLVLLDFGSVGRLSAKRREQVLVVLGSLVDADVGAVSDVLMDWAGRAGPAPPGLEQGVERFFVRYAADSGRPIRLAEAIAEFISIAREHALTLPPDLLLLMRALGIAEGLARTLDPDLDVVGAIAPVVVRAFASRFEPKAMAARAFRAFKELDQILAMAPEAIRRSIGRVRREGLIVQVSSSDLADLPRAVRRAGDSLALGVVLAALIVAAAIVSVAHDDQVAPLGRVVILVLSGAGLVAFLWRLSRRD
ncbi:MAG: AarF/UbiB family protein [Phenylobacterium sp.]|uniref:ABC1 kinase family protein n=1 Tax=Phenylobacterium sp. TaxID=1871053 RepID=UPI002721CEE9|nr:AarF/UbiB family protein [Phenylobacterium sp.]MDO8911201.1 AarF/UbiB family protein [Phenylobacterium sp.]MDP3100744.1 AarF/UbiB family protein [Phenylobacterium sp.]